MADNRALFAAFQKVRADVDQALEETRRKEAEKRAAEEAARLEERRLKRAGIPAAKSPAKSAPVSLPKAPAKPGAPAAKPLPKPVAKPQLPKEPQKFAAPKGAFGSMLADAAAASGAVFREAGSRASAKDRKDSQAKAEVREAPKNQTAPAGAKSARGSRPNPDRRGARAPERRGTPESRRPGAGRPEARSGQGSQSRGHGG